MPRPVVIGIAGGSGSGKSTVLQHIIDTIGENRIAVLDHDSYYHDLTHLSQEERAGVNFDHPDALETQLLRRHLDDLLEWKTVEKPIYDFNTHARSSRTTPVEARPVVIVEGILVLAEPLLAEKMDIRIFVDAAPDVRLMRRIRRDMIDRGRSIESILAQYEGSVRPMHIQFVEPSKLRADVIIPRGGHNSVAIEMVLARIVDLLKRAEKAEPRSPG